MTYKSYLDDYTISIEKARQQVERASIAYSKGGSVEAVNRANKALGDAHARWRECQNGNVEDDR